MVGVRVLGRAGIALALGLGPTLLLSTASIARQDGSALFAPPGDMVLGLVQRAVGVSVAPAAEGGGTEQTPMLAAGVALGKNRAVFRSADGAVFGSIPLGDHLSAELRVNRANKGDRAMTRLVRSEPGAREDGARFAAAFGADELLPDGDFSRELPPISARADPAEDRAGEAGKPEAAEAGAPPAVLASAPATEATVPAADGAAEAPPPPPETGALSPPLPRAPEGAIAPLDPRLLRLSIAGPEEELRAKGCLAEAVYFEARGESERGQRAVAQVVLNRVQSGRYPKSVCDVVYQNRERLNRCQFSFACDGRDGSAGRVRDMGAWRQAWLVASEAIEGRSFLQEIGDSLFYHADYVAPRWRRRLARTEQIGSHIFYRLPGLVINGS